jgi:predicted permease
MLHDFRLAIRTLRRTPAFFVLATVTLALGIAANTAIVTLVRGVLLRPLPYADPSAIISIWTTTPSADRGGQTAGEFIDLQRENRTLAAVAGYRRDLFAVVPSRGPARQVEGVHVTVDFFDIFGVPALAGRPFTRALDATPAEPSVVLSESVARELFGDPARAPGARLRINSEPHTVAGVMPARFEWPINASLWRLSPRPVPPSPIEIAETDRDVRYFDAVARLRRDVTVAAAQADLHALATGPFADRRPPNAEPRDLRAAAIHDDLVSESRPAILLLQAGVAIVLLIGCANVSGLIIARTAARRPELAVRAALGAKGGRLVRVVLAESIVLGVTGGLTGLLLGAWTLSGLRRVLPDSVPRLDAVTLDGALALAVLVVAVAASACVALVPALQASRTNAAEVLREVVRGSSARTRGRSTLAVLQMALTFVLLVSAALLVNSLVRLQRVETGYDTARVTLAGVSVPATRYPDEAAQTGFYARLLEALSSRPEFDAVAIGFPAPLRGENASGSYVLDGHATTAGADRPFAYVGSVSNRYFEALGIDLLTGRTFTDADTAEAPSVAIVNAALARRDWPNESAVGKRLRFGAESDVPWITVVGVVDDVRHIGLDRAAPPVLYLPYRQFTLPFTSLAVKSGQPEALVNAALRDTLAAVDPEVPLGDVETLGSVVNAATEEPRFRMSVFAALGFVAVVLAAVGLYGVISTFVQQQTREIGIRIALGASPRRIQRAVFGRALRLAAGGVAIGVGAALLAARALGGFLYGIAATDPWTYALTAAALIGISLAASYAPARRVLAVDPVVSLRN